MRAISDFHQLLSFLFHLIFISFLTVFMTIVVLSYGIDTVATNVTLNSSVVAEICGANFCGASDAEDENPNLQPPPIERIHLISGIYLGCMIVACLIIAFGVDSLSRYTHTHTIARLRLFSILLRKFWNMNMTKIVGCRSRSRFTRR